MKLLTNAQILQDGELIKVSILIDGKHIKKIAPQIDVDADTEEIDVKGQFLLCLHQHLFEVQFS